MLHHTQSHPQMLRQAQGVLQLKSGLENCFYIVWADIRSGLKAGIKQVGGIHAPRKTQRSPRMILKKIVKRHLVFLLYTVILCT